MWKHEARRLIDQLPDDATWDDVLRAIEVRKAIESGLADSDSGRVVGVNEVREQYGLPPLKI
jgi:hypothetical protein